MSFALIVLIIAAVVNVGISIITDSFPAYISGVLIGASICIAALSN